MKKLFVSVPMKGRTKEEVFASTAKMKAIAEIYVGEQLELVDSYVLADPPADSHKAIWYLAKALEKLSEADLAIGIDDYENWNGCAIEMHTAQCYGIKTYTVPAVHVIDNYSETLKASKALKFTGQPA